MASPRSLATRKSRRARVYPELIQGAIRQAKRAIGMPGSSELDRAIEPLHRIMMYMAEAGGHVVRPRLVLNGQDQ